MESIKLARKNLRTTYFEMFLSYLVLKKKIFLIFCGIDRFVEEKKHIVLPKPNILNAKFCDAFLCKGKCTLWW